MGITRSGGRRSSGMKRLFRLIGGAMVFCVFWGMPACTGDFSNVLTNANGDAIRLEAIESIVQDSELTTEEKREALRDLGITDEDYIDLVVREL